MPEKLKFRLPERQQVLDYAAIVVGSFLYAASVVIFVRPANVPMGGISGICLLLNYLFGLPIGLMTMAFNLPLFLFGYKSMKTGLLIETVFATVISSVFVDVLAPVLPPFRGDILLALLYGGVGMALGVGLVLMRGCTMGGLDIVFRIVNRRFGTPIGSMGMALSVAVIGASTLVYGRVESAMYAIVMQFVYSRVVDGMLYGVDRSTGVFIITGKPREVSEELMRVLHRGVTSLSGTGMYTGSPRSVLICAVRRQEASFLKRIVAELDPQSFVMFTDVNQVVGKGFKHYDQ